MAQDTFKYTVMQNPNWDFRTLDIGTDMPRARKTDNGVVSATSTNLKPYVGHGGKLIIYHGWADQNVAPLSSVNYYNELIQVMGKKVVEDSVRLYMAPGMGHCAGGEGPSVFDTLTPLEQSKEKGVAPRDRRVANRERQRNPHASAVPVSARGRVQGHRQHRPSREFRADCRSHARNRTPWGQELII